MKRYLRSKKRRESIGKNGKNTSLESRDFSVVEDSPEFISVLRELGATAAINAAAEAKAAGLPHTFARGNQIICVHADGREEVVASASDENIKGGSYYIHPTYYSINVPAK